MKLIYDSRHEDEALSIEERFAELGYWNERIEAASELLGRLDNDLVRAWLDADSEEDLSQAVERHRECVRVESDGLIEANDDGSYVLLREPARA